MLLEATPSSRRYIKGQTKHVNSLLQVSSPSTEIVLRTICTLQAQLLHASSGYSYTHACSAIDHWTSTLVSMATMLGTVHL